ncbi:biopolymer transporter ExbD [Alcaligenaceae bacterium LF4-65]|jgi:biopolymer transport protein ExbD|uniref:Biopolymer transporter ExbD n=1 Tax=Zwartia hollandica TaxID=324606 RepID=A0A953N864_9BURK|nr:biopolymer transporter ExbD [Zwartia hollandica]MBZ1349358.1 biopolymer transporter ExbD [Zwartia hollandica]
MNFRHANQSDDGPDINLIPLIDVLLVMLIFLAATTTFTRQQAIKINLPQANAEASDAAPIELAISQDGRFAVAGKLVASNELVLTLKAAGQRTDQSVVLIRADSLAAHQFVVFAMQAAREAGIGRVHFATQARD